MHSEVGLLDRVDWPDGIEQFLLRHRALALLHQYDQQVEGAAAQFDGPPVRQRRRRGIRR
jgi:hypothetical protein